MDDDSKRHIAEDFAAGLLEGDFERMRSSLSTHATWSVPDETSISGVATGADAVIERARSITSSGEVSIELQRVLYGLEDVALMLHNTGRRGDVVLDELVVVALTLSGGAISTVTNLISDVDGLNAFFAATS